MTASKPCVLLVDDVPANLVALEALLADLPCDTVRATSGNDALRQLLKREFAVMLVDVQMPEMDGFEVARYARAHPATREVPIIFVTAMHASDEDTARGYGSGAVDFLFKPLNPHILRAKVQVFLDLYASRKRLADEIRAHRRTLAQLETLSYSISHDLHAPAMIERVAELMVPAFADWAVVTLGEADEASISAGAHRDPEQRPLLAGLRLRAARGRAELHEEVSERRLAQLAGGEVQLATLRQLGVGSLMLVPLHARGRDLGGIALASTEPGRQFTRADLAVAEELGRRAALAIDNALLYAQAQEAIRLRDDFLSVASHELRTPLTTLQLRQQAVLRALAREPDSPTHRDVIAKLEQAVKKAKRLGQLIESLLDVSRISAGLLLVDMQELDLGELVAEMARDFEDVAAQAGSRIELDVERGVVGLWDRMRIGQVVTNLMSNAVKFGAGKPIEVGVAQADGRAVLRVRDRGIGLDAASQARIFGRFERAVSVRNYGGLGLGLYITRRVVEAHGGSISVESTPGEGATFTVELPLAPPA